MASGIVAKKIALFEVKPQSLEQQCRLKRKHAIRRKKYWGKERRIVIREGTSMIALSTSDEHLNQLKDSDEEAYSSSSSTTHPHYSKFSASCSALFDMVSVESSESGVTVEDKTLMEIIPRNKRLFVKSGSKENYSKRVNIIDIDIEIKIGKKEHQRDSSPVFVTACDEYEPLLLEVEKPDCLIKPSTLTPAPVAITTDRIHLTALVDEDLSAERSVTYYCSKCSHEPAPDKKPIKENSNKEDKAVSSDEPFYENIFTSVPPPPVSLGAPPLPPKRLFGDSFTTNYSCLPALYSRGKTKAQISDSNATSPSQLVTENRTNRVNDETETKTAKPIDSSIKCSRLPKPRNNKGSSSDDVDLLRIKDHVTESSGGNPLSSATISSKDVVTTTETPAICFEKDGREKLSGSEAVVGDDDEEEPFYEDLYDYCNGPDRGTSDLLNPLLELFRDQLNSLELNVEDEVEYCDCSTILNLMSRTTESAGNDKENLQQPEEISTREASTYGEDFSTEADFSSSTYKSYEIYDDCFGVETTALGQMDQDGGMKNNCDISNDDDIGAMPKSVVEKNYIASIGTTSSFSSSHILTDYIRSKVTKASTPGCWRKITSSAEPEGVLMSENPNTKKIVSASASTSASNTLSVFPSLSVSKTKLVEPNGATAEQQRAVESLPNEASASSPQVIAENERNVSKTKNANNGCIIYAYGMLKIGNNNGNSKPRFGGRPVIAHPMDEEKDQADKGENNDGDSEASLSGDGLSHKNYTKDDNEIFNKPLPLPPPNSSPYESVYDEPIYGITNQLTATYSDNGKPSGGSPGKRRSSAPAAPAPFTSNKLLSSSKPGSNYSHSPSISSGSTYGYSSGSVNAYGDTGSTPKYGQSVASPSSINASVSSTASDGMSIYGVNDKLPPTPPSKFSSIAKTAGRKIAKKFLGIRKNSKCGFEEPLSVFSTNGVDSVDITGGGSQHSNSTDVQGSKGSNPADTNYNGSDKSACSNGGGAQIRRPISRPSIPPPEPPRNEICTTVPPIPPDKGNDYNIYDKKNDDDYEDSDFYDSDSELIRNFVSQVQPIYSMEEEPLYQYYTYGISLKFLAARTNSEVERWKSKLDAMSPKEELRVEAIFPYDARRPDEMSFYVGDVIRVTQMQPDGWYFGMKLATGESGWFPGNYCCENAS